MAKSFKSVSEIVSSLRSQLAVNSRQALKALVTLFNRQTEDEQIAEHTRHMNFRGFNHNDAKILTSIAKQYIGGKILSERQMEVVMRLVPKYAGQLVKQAISNGTYRKEGRIWVY